MRCAHACLTKLPCSGTTAERIRKSQCQHAVPAVTLLQQPGTVATARAPAVCSGLGGGGGGDGGQGAGQAQHSRASAPPGGGGGGGAKRDAGGGGDAAGRPAAAAACVSEACLDTHTRACPGHGDPRTRDHTAGTSLPGGLRYVPHTVGGPQSPSRAWMARPPRLCCVDASTHPMHLAARSRRCRRHGCPRTSAAHLPGTRRRTAESRLTRRRY